MITNASKNMNNEYQFIVFIFYFLCKNTYYYVYQQLLVVNFFVIFIFCYIFDNINQINMPAPKGNQYYKLADSANVGRKPKYTPTTLLDKFNEYAKWVVENPLYESKGFGSGVILKLPKMRAMTITGFAVYAGIISATFYEYEKNKEYTYIITHIRDVMFSQKFEGAAAELLNPNIIAHELGLIDQSKYDVNMKADVQIQMYLPENGRETADK